MNAASEKPGANSKPDSAAAGGAARRISLVDNCMQSSELFAATREITIAHGVDTYRLRLTSQNKLILTK